MSITSPHFVLKNPLAERFALLTTFSIRTIKIPNHPDYAADALLGVWT